MDSCFDRLVARLSFVVLFVCLSCTISAAVERPLDVSKWPRYGLDIRHGCNVGCFKAAFTLLSRADLTTVSMP